MDRQSEFRFFCKAFNLTVPSFFVYVDWLFLNKLYFYVQVREGEQGDVETRRIVRYPDSHQLFVGNLPHDVDKSELKEFFQSKLATLLYFLGFGVMAICVVNRAF